MSKQRRPNLKIEEISQALWASGGFISKTAEKLGVCQATITNRIKRSAVLQQVRKDVESTYLDLAESQLVKGVKAGDNACIFFYLKCKGKHRGYVERQEVKADVKLSHDDWINKLDEPD